MKKTLFFILMILVLMVSSCNLFLKEEYGELILSFDGSLPDGARALDSNGLPILSSSRMKIDIIRNDGYTVTRELGAEEPKSLVELVPVGEKIEIIVTAINPSGQWSGRAFHTVVSGQNHVKVLLNKNISGLNNLLFTQTKIDDSGQDAYELKFYIGGKEINAHDSEEEYSFARDSKGRLYVRYKAGDSYLVRYTSEGELDVHSTAPTTIEFLANDYTTGKKYGLSGITINKIEENLTLTSPFPTSPPVSAPFAADNGIFTWASIGSSVIRLWKDGMPLSGVQGSFSVQTHAYNLGTNDGFAIKDIFIRNGYVYVLFAGVQSNISHGLYSLGAVLKWKIGTDPANGNPRFEGSPVVLGKSAGSPVIENGVLKNYDYSKNFYGAVKVIGFDEENIYIADDGFDAAYVDYAPHIVKNRNRIAALNIATNALSFSDAGSAKWYNEWKEWEGVKTKILLWKADDNSYTYYGTKYWIGDTAETPCPSNDDEALWVSSVQQVLPTDVFCYDQGGNLYIYADGVNGGFRRFAIKEDGSYDKSSAQDLDMSSSVNAIAVDISDGENYLYYVKAYSSPRTIKRFKWGHSSHETFDNAEPDTEYSISVPTNGEITALAANKDGVFVNSRIVSAAGYTLSVEKYKKEDGTFVGKITVGIEQPPVATEPSPPYPDYIKLESNINSLQIVDGVLYAITSKIEQKMKKRANFPPIYGIDNFRSSSVLYKVGKTEGGFSGNAEKLNEKNVVDSPEPGTGYNFYRFIAVKPKKLVIASDGAWGKNGFYGSHSEANNNKVFEYNLYGNLDSPDEKDSGGVFSHELIYNSATPPSTTAHYTWK
ncbi:hypothetical protein E4N83_03225 [Treponema denticola]|uniref:hypothetical protein n=1 Tax=Treponema denticola TaxID=158 RepID=UPI0020A4A96D|nr:hypothetical protein [Treponema denticola]UTC97312.1 hypothetical protein E4N83_03225 [Treponema denticola]